MSTEKKLVPDFKLYRPASGSGNWYVEFYAPHRIKKYGNINSAKTEEEKKSRAEKLIFQLTKEYSGHVTDLEKGVMDIFYKDSKVLSHASVRSYKSILTKCFRFLRGRSLTKEAFEGYFDHLYETVSGTTHNQALDVLNHYMRKVGEKYILCDIEKVAATKTPAKYFQNWQAKRILDYVEQHDQELLLMIKFIYFTLARPKELRFQMPINIYYDDWKMLFPSSLSKNKKSQYVSIPEAFREDIITLMDYPLNDYIFSGRNGGPIGKNTLGERHRKVLKKLNFPVNQGYSLYSWKHTGAVNVARAGISLKELQLQMRHHSLDQVDAYLRQMGVLDMPTLNERYPSLPTGAPLTGNSPNRSLKIQRRF